MPMNYKPWPIIIIALIHIFAPLGNSILNSYRWELSIFDYWNIKFQQQSVLYNILYLSLPMLAGYFIYVCRRWSYYAYLCTLVMMITIGFYGFLTQVSWVNFILFTTFIILDFLLVAYFMVPAVKNIYLDPRLRWWETSPRYNFKAKVEIKDLGEVLVENISLGGLLFKSKFIVPDSQVLILKLSWEEISINLTGKVVHHRMMGDHGYGFQFDSTTIQNKGWKQFVSTISKSGYEVIKPASSPDKNFMVWVKNVLSTGQGLIPSTPGRK